MGKIIAFLTAWGLLDLFKETKSNPIGCFGAFIQIAMYVIGIVAFVIFFYMEASK